MKKCIAILVLLMLIPTASMAKLAGRLVKDSGTITLSNGNQYTFTTYQAFQIKMEVNGETQKFRSGKVQKIVFLPNDKRQRGYFSGPIQVTDWHGNTTTGEAIIFVRGKGFGCYYSDYGIEKEGYFDFSKMKEIVFD